MSYYLSLKLPLLFVWLTCELQTLQTAKLRCLSKSGGTWWSHKVGEKRRLHGLCTHSGMNRTPWLHLNNTLCMYFPLSWWHFRFPFNENSSAAGGLQPDPTNPHWSSTAWNSPLVFLAPAGETHLSAAFSCAAWMLPLMCLFVCWVVGFFPLVKGELAQTFLGVLTGFNEQLMSRSRTSTNQTVLLGGLQDIQVYPGSGYWFLLLCAAKVPRKVIILTSNSIFLYLNSVH